MATLLNLELVHYQCSCKQWHPLAKLYFCRHCLVLRCGSCATHEVDSIYCPNCLENMPSAEARLKKNRCGNCFDCPWCGHVLSTRAASLLDPSKTPVEEQSPPEKGPGSGKKVYYLSCLYCRWSSREAGIPDQTVATGNWPEHENPHVGVMNNVLDQLRQLALIEKTERERKKYTKRRSHIAFYSDKYATLLTRRRLGLGLSDKEQSETNKPVATIEASEDVEPLPDDVFTKDVNLEEITTVRQRLSHPESQPVRLKDLYPLRKQLMCKRSQRCKECEHNLCKAEFNPSSIKFKIQLCAIFHVPEVRLAKPVALIVGQKQFVYMTITNLTAALMHVVLLPNVETADDSRFVNFELPVTELAIPVKDDTTEFEEQQSQSQMQNFKDDQEVVVSRRGHKLGIRLSVDVNPDQAGKDLLLSFIMKYDYMNTLLHLIGEQKEPEIVWLQQKVIIRLDKTVTEGES